MLSRWRPDAGGERGSATVEFAVALPAVLGVLGLCLGGLQAVGHQLILADAAVTTARVIARGEEVPTSLASGADRRTETEGDLLCVTLSAPSRAVGLSALGVTVSSRACALDERAAR